MIFFNIVLIEDSFNVCFSTLSNNIPFTDTINVLIEYFWKLI